MRDFYYISHRFSPDKILKAERFLIDNNLINIAKFQKEGFLAGICSIRLPVEDTRNSLFIDEIKKDNSEPILRFDREYTSKELEIYPFLVLIIKTVHLSNPYANQIYDYSSACPNCGAGILPIIPIYVPENKMGKKLIEFTAHNGWPVFRHTLKNTLEENNITGIKFNNIILGKDKENFYIGFINSILPKLDPSSKINFNHSICATCHNSGNFHNFSSETSYVYKKSNVQNLKDFNLTHEYFGEWKYSKLGGARHIVISQKVRQILLQNKVKYLDFIPIELSNN